MRSQSDGGAVGIIAIIILVAIVSILLASGIISTGVPTPTARLSILPNTISVQSNHTSSSANPITIELSNVQNANNTVFHIVLASSNSTNAYAVYFNGTRLNTIDTTPLVGVEPFTSRPFEIFGKLPQGVTSSVGYNITVNLYYKTTLLDTKTLQITVTK